MYISSWVGPFLNLGKVVSALMSVKETLICSISFEGCVHVCVCICCKRELEWEPCPHSRSFPSLFRLREDASALKSGWDAQIAQLSKEMISKDLQVQSLQEEEVKLKAQLARCQQDIGRYHVVGEGDEDGAAGWVVRGGLSHRVRFSVCTRAVKVCVPFGPVSGITSEVFCLTVSVFSYQLE